MIYLKIEYYERKEEITNSGTQYNTHSKGIYAASNLNSFNPITIGFRFVLEK